jgi:PII-like signaling protein
VQIKLEELDMDPAGPSALLRIFTRERARGGGRALYEAIVLKAREAGLAGATVLRGPLSFGQSKRLHNANILNLSDDLPIVIEIVDGEARLRAFCASLESFRDIGLVTLEKVEILHYGKDAPEATRG